MATVRNPRQRVECRLAEQRFSGTVEEVAGQVDQLIAILVALRHDLRVNLRVEAPPAKHITRAWARLLSIGQPTLLLGAVWWVGNRTGTW